MSLPTAETRSDSRLNSVLSIGANPDMPTWANRLLHFTDFEMSSRPLVIWDFSFSETTHFRKKNNVQGLKKVLHLVQVLVQTHCKYL